MKKKQKFSNRLKESLIKDLDRVSLDDNNSDLTKRSKYNLSYFDSNQEAGHDFSDLNNKQSNDLLNSLKEFSKSSLGYWEVQGTLIMYDHFPISTEFIHPRHVPHQVRWGRFRLGSKARLVGFTVPEDLHGKQHHETEGLYDKNTFYIVFIDQDHLFWNTEKK